MNSIVETISAFIQQAAGYIKELFLLLYYGAHELGRIEGSTFWAKVQSGLAEMGIPIWVAYLVAALSLVGCIGLLVKLTLRRSKKAAPAREVSAKPEKEVPEVPVSPPMTTSPEVTTTAAPEIIPVVTTTPAPPATTPGPVATTTQAPVPDQPPVVTTPPPPPSTTPIPMVITTPPPPEPTTTPAPVKKISFFDRLKKGLNKTRQWLTDDLNAIFSSGKLDEETLEDLEEMLITADVGVQTSMEIVEQVAKQQQRIENSTDLKTVLQEIVLNILEDEDDRSATAVSDHPKPRVMMVVGVNGVGKTTTIGKLAAHYAANGQKVLLAAADTFRAAAVEQLTIWADRANADIVKHKEGSDPAAVAFDSVDAALARNVDVVLVDTAGRLHTKVNLMEEIKKVQRSINKRLPEAPHETLLVLDATTGQNGLAQAHEFNSALGLTGLVLTKLDGTAKGGVVIGICDTLNVPLQYVGVGEQIDDLQPFEPNRFVKALFH